MALGGGRWLGVAALAGLAVGVGASCALGDGCLARLSLVSPGGPADDFGRSAAALGDLDGDGWTDLAVGAPEDGEGGEHAGAVYVFSGRDGGLIRKIVGPPGSRTGWSLAAAGDVNGDGVPDVIVGAPAYQPPVTNANTQPYKFMPLLKAMGEQRVDFVCPAGDSNHFYDRFGFNGGVQMALTQHAPMYATPLQSPNENEGQGMTQWGSFMINSTGGYVGQLVWAPPFFLAQWDVSAAPAIIAGLQRFAYWDATQSLPALAVFGLQLDSAHPIDLGAGLVFHIDYGRFAGGTGVIEPEVLLGYPPYAHVYWWSGLSCSSATGDRMDVASLALPADPAREGPLVFRVSIVEGAPLMGQVFIPWMRVENPDRAAGFSFSTLWAVGGKSARDAAEFIMDVPMSSLTHYFEQVRRLQGPDKKIVIYMNEGGNDRIDSRVSYHGPAQSWSPAGFRDNMTTVRDRIFAVWDANGWPKEELYFLLLGYHVLSDYPDLFAEGTLRTLRQVCRDLSGEWPRTTCVDMSAFMTSAEGEAQGWYTDGYHAHLTYNGYRELGNRIVNAMYSAVAQPGAVRIYSGADGSVLRTLDPGPQSTAGDELGLSVSRGGDVNGDGIEDIAAGAPSRFNDDIPGRVHIFSGADGALLRTLTATDGRDRFGQTVCMLGDTDGDGVGDVAVGDPDDRSLFAGVGSVSVWSGATGLRRWRQPGGQGTEDFATALDLAGDVDGDGVRDVVVGIPGRSKSGPNTGAARVFGGASGALLGGIDGQAPGDRLGTSVAGLGDVDGDGKPDVAVGAPGGDGPAPDAGAARAYSVVGVRLLSEFRGHVAAEARGGVVASAGTRPDGVHELLITASGVVDLVEARGPCCTADFVRDGTEDFTDFLEFLNLYTAGATTADLNRDGVVDFADYLEFLTRYDAGC